MLATNFNLIENYGSSVTDATVNAIIIDIQPGDAIIEPNSRGVDRVGRPE